MSIANQVALVTGAGSGIGKSIALLFAKEGAQLVLTDINEEHGNEVVKAVEKAGAKAIFVKADSSKPADNQKVVEKALESFGRLDIAVNNAGIGGPVVPTGEYTLEAWDKVISINLSGVFYGMRYQLPAMEKQGKGSIINVASILGQVGFANSVAYVAAKHGVVGLTKNAGIEYATKGIRVNAIGPGFIETPLVQASLSQEQYNGLAALHAMNRLGKPEEVAELVLWLASDKASFVTGSYYAVDGGYLAR